MVQFHKDQENSCTAKQVKTRRSSALSGLNLKFIMAFYIKVEMFERPISGCTTEDGIHEGRARILWKSLPEAC